MKKIILSVFAFTMISSFAISQNIRLNAYTSYVFDNSFTSDYVYGTNTYYSGTIKGGFQYGLGLEFLPGPEVGVEIMYIGQQTTAPATYQGYLTSSSVSDMNINYMMLGTRRYMRKPGSKVEGYGGLMAGCVWAKIENSDFDLSTTVTKFAWGARLGLNIWASEKIAVNLEAQLLSAPQAWGGGFYFGTGGSGTTVTTYSTLYQFSLGGGITYALGK